MCGVCARALAYAINRLTGREPSIRFQHEPLRPGGWLRRSPVEDRPQQGSRPGVHGGVHDVRRLVSGSAQVLRGILERTRVSCRLKGFIHCINGILVLQHTDQCGIAESKGGQTGGSRATVGLDLPLLFYSVGDFLHAFSMLAAVVTIIVTVAGVSCCTYYLLASLSNSRHRSHCRLFVQDGH